MAGEFFQRFGLLLLIVAVLVACRLDVKPLVVEWDHDPGALIVEVGTFGGPFPLPGDSDYLPDVQVWGDGRIVWTERQDNGSRVAWEGYLSEEALTNLLQFIVEEGFFDWRDHYQPDNLPDGLPTTCIAVNMADRSKRVSQYFEGAPVGFGRILQRVRQSADGANPLTP
jgi:hypothetical protein